MHGETITIERSLLNPDGLIVTVTGGPGIREYALSVAAHKLTEVGLGDAELVKGIEFPDGHKFVFIYEMGVTL